MLVAAPRAQNPQPPVSAASQASTKPDQLAYREVAKIKDPQERLRALRQFLADWPKSEHRFGAHAAIIDISLDNIAHSAKEVVAAADARLAEAKDERNICLEHFFLAFNMLRREALLDVAEQHARAALRHWDTPGTGDLPAAAGMSLAEADVRSLLGQILYKLGRPDEAEPLLRQACERRDTDFKFGVASLPYLADIALARGREADALVYLTEMELGGTMPAARREQFQALYRKAHGGSLESLDWQLDERYAATHPKLAVTPYEPGAARTGRAVLAEVFTGAACGPCVGVDRAFDAVLDRYERGDVIVLMHHVHIPSPDPLANEATEARQKFYRVGSAPHFFIDGIEPSSGGGGTADEAATILSKEIEPALGKSLRTPPGARLSLHVTSKGTSVRVAVTADRIEQPSRALKLHVALVEDHVRYVGRNGVRFHSMVVRAMAGDAAGIALKGRKKVAAEQVFDLGKVSADLKAYLDDYEAHGEEPGPAPSERSELKGFKFDEKKYQLDPTRLAVVAFLQDEDGKRVLQAVYAPVKLN